MPPGGKSKRVKDGGCLASNADGSLVYALKGNNRCEFYRYNALPNTWAASESIPAIGAGGKKKAVKKGAAMAEAGGRVYAAKGRNESAREKTLDFRRVAT